MVLVFKLSLEYFNLFDLDSSAGTTGVLTYTIADTDLQVAVLWSVPYSYAFYSNVFNVKVSLNFLLSNAALAQ